MASYFDSSGSESTFGIFQDPSMCAHAFLRQGGFYRRGLQVISITPFWTSKKPSEHEPSWGVLLSCRMRNMWSLVFYLGRAQPPLWIVLLLIFWNFCPQGMNSNCLPLAGKGIYLLPQGHKSVFCNCFLLNVGVVTILGRGGEVLPQFL